MLGKAGRDPVRAARILADRCVAPFGRAQTLQGPSRRANSISPSYTSSGRSCTDFIPAVHRTSWVCAVPAMKSVWTPKVARPAYQRMSTALKPAAWMVRQVSRPGSHHASRRREIGAQHRCMRRDQVPGGDATCSKNTKTPPGRNTRPISPSTRSWSVTKHKTWEATTASTLASARGMSSAAAAITGLRCPYPAVPACQVLAPARVRLQADPIDVGGEAGEVRAVARADLEYASGELAEEFLLVLRVGRHVRMGRRGRGVVRDALVCRFSLSLICSHASIRRCAPRAALGRGVVNPDRRTMRAWSARTPERCG